MQHTVNLMKKLLLIISCAFVARLLLILLGVSQVAANEFIQEATPLYV